MSSERQSIVRELAHLSDDDYTDLAKTLFEEEDRMIPDLYGRTWADQNVGDVGFYENCVKAVLRKYASLKFMHSDSRGRLASSNDERGEI